MISLTQVTDNVPNIPSELTALENWVAWKYAIRAGKKTKIPVNAITGREAKSNDALTWTTFDYALQKSRDAFEGIGFVFSAAGVHAGVDLDHCIDEQGNLKLWAAEILAALNTYAEVSPSGTGIKLFCRGRLPTKKTGTRRPWHDGQVEMYQSGRFFTVTGNHYPGTPATVNDCQAALDKLWAEITPPMQPPTIYESAPVTVEDAKILDKARGASNGAKFAKLFGGNHHGYVSQSEADQALCNLLAFWTGPDADAIDRLFRQSGLMRKKWEAHSTYRHETISRAIEGCQEFYNWNGKTAPRSSKSANTQSAELASAKPRIDTTMRDLEVITAQAWEAVRIGNEPPTLYRHGGIAARLEKGDNNEPVIRSIEFNRMRHALARFANWTSVKQRGEESIEVLTAPPRDVVEDVLATPNMPLPILARVVEAPVFAHDGTLLTTAGYHPASQTIYAPARGFRVNDIPERPTGQDIESAAIVLTDELLGDFPFVGDCEKAHAVALMILPFVRDMVDGPTPLHLFEKPTPGTGATLLADMLAWPATGRPLPAMTEGRDEDEWRKRLTSKFRSGSAFLFIDNLRRRLDSAAIASAITTPTWEDRVLGVSEVCRIPVKCAWIASGNNPALSSEMARRTIRSRMDAKIDRPWLRSGFRHPDLRSWAINNRPLLVWSILTLGRAWLAAGRPAGTQTLGMFENWSKVIGGILDVAGIPGFLGNLNEFYEESDAEGATWRAFLSAWWDRFQAADVKSADLYSIATSDGCLSLGDGSEQSQRVVLGKMLNEKRDRVFDITIGDSPTRFVVNRGKQQQRAYVWTLNRLA